MAGGTRGGIDGITRSGIRGNLTKPRKYIGTNSPRHKRRAALSATAYLRSQVEGWSFDNRDGCDEMFNAC
jgi:hypothetical protein